MIIAKKVVLWILPSQAIKKGSNILSSDGLVKLEKSEFPVLRAGETYVLDVPPYGFRNSNEQFETATVDVHNLEYHEADGGFFLLTCIANPRGYAGLCLAYGETKI